MARHLFISDLHLREDGDDVTRRFIDWLGYVPQAGDTLHIVGDLFNAWYALPSDPEMPLRGAIEAVGQLPERGVNVDIVVGNRDFLLLHGNPFPAAVRVIDGPRELDLGGRRTYLGHGDELCVRDYGYRLLRAVLRSPAVLAVFMRMPFGWRRAIAGGLRAGSRHRPQRALHRTLVPVIKSYADLCLADDRYDLVIHGHLHERTVQTMQAQDHVLRAIVLPSWDDEWTWLCYDSETDRACWVVDGGREEDVALDETSDTRAKGDP